jgi:site-specific DNA-methyltransferase (adenine-specific)
MGDCIEVAKRIPTGSVDLIVTDPPYGIGGDRLHQHYKRREDFVVDGYIEVPADEYLEFSHGWIREAARVLKPGGSLYVVSGYTHLYEVLDALRATDLEEVNHLVWKYNFGVHTTRKYVSSHYHILFCVKPGAPHTFNVESRFGLDEKADDGGSLNYRDREDVWTINREYRPGQRKNKNELPTELLTRIVQYSSDPGDLVADFFLGSGGTAAVAIGLGRQALGIERSPAMFGHAAAMVAGIVPGSLQATLRSPQPSEKANQGKPWTAEDMRRLRKRWTDLRRQGTPKGKAIDALGAELGRGRFALKNALEKAGVDDVAAGERQRRLEV